MITADPAQDSRTGVYADGLEPCTQCEQRFDPADLCDVPGNEGRCKACAEDSLRCAECEDEHAPEDLDAAGHCPACAALYANLPHPVPATAA
jgi:hypothetical protein